MTEPRLRTEVALAMSTLGNAFSGVPVSRTNAVPPATVVADDQGVITAWSRTAREMFGHPASDACGRPVLDLLADDEDRRALTTAVLERRRDGWEGNLVVRHRDGHPLRIHARVEVLARTGEPPVWLISAVDARDAGWREDGGQAVCARAIDQFPANIVIMDTALVIRELNASSLREIGLPPEQLVGLRPSDLPYVFFDADAFERESRRVLDTGEPLIGLRMPGRSLEGPDQDRVWSASVFRLEEATGGVLGVCGSFVDVTVGEQAQDRLRLLTEASGRIGTTLDVIHTAGELADAAVPQLADFATIDLLEGVVDGDEPVLQPSPEGPATCRAGISSIHLNAPEVRYQVGQETRYASSTPQGQCLATGQPVLVPKLDLADGWFSEDSERSAKIRAFGIHSLMAVPLRARGVTLGVASFNRTVRSLPFDASDLALAVEFCSRAAVCIDNARRYTREYVTALALQRRLLPRLTPATSCLEVAHRYLPADRKHAAGGDWFDVFPLSGARTALVVGDALGHGLDAAATMGRLRAAVQTLADLDLPPDEVLARLDDLVGRLADEERGEEEDESRILGSTCLFAIYDPVTRRCTMARAGHWPPVLVDPEGTVTILDLPPGPPLGLGGLPFETLELELAEGSMLALFTDGLIDAPGADITATLGTLTDVLGRWPGKPLETICDAVVDELLPETQRDDAALLLVSTRALPADRIALWPLPSAPQVVAQARALATAQLTRWGLEELSFSTELIVSELVTNAMRHGKGPITLRLIRDRVLSVEVFDSSLSSPHLRHARTMEEGGRGVFLVAQLAARWGTRYGPGGKTIWAEQPLP